MENIVDIPLSDKAVVAVVDGVMDLLAMDVGFET